MNVETLEPRLLLSTVTWDGDAGDGNWNTNVIALDGGVLDLSGVSAITEGAVDVLADGSGSVVNLSSLASVISTTVRSSMEARDTGSIVLRNLTRFAHGDEFAHGNEVFGLPTAPEVGACGEHSLRVLGHWGELGHQVYTEVWAV